MNPAKIRVAIQPGLLSEPLGDLSAVRLMGTRCRICGEVGLGTNPLCLNCGSDQVAPLRLSSEGEIWTYTVVRHKPPGNYRGPEPFQPFALGLIELPEGLRVMAPLAGDPDAVAIGRHVRFHPFVRDDGERQTVSFDFEHVAN